MSQKHDDLTCFVEAGSWGKER